MGEYIRELGRRGEGHYEQNICVYEIPRISKNIIFKKDSSFSIIRKILKHTQYFLPETRVIDRMCRNVYLVEFSDKNNRHEDLRQGHMNASKWVNVKPRRGDNMGDRAS